jgi:release factor glutamine methyltransferase
MREVVAQALVRQHAQVRSGSVSGGHAVTAQTVAFGALTIAYDERLLSPRTWTLHQSRWALELLEDLPEGPILELCAGAGQIGLAVAAQSTRRLISVDADPVAARYTSANASSAGVRDRVQIRLSPVRLAVRPHESFPLILADPPWVPRNHVDRFPEDPLTAIDGGPEGLDVARECVDVIGTHLAPHGRALLQLGAEPQVEALDVELRDRNLRVRDIRAFGDRGVLVLLSR